MKFSIIIPAWRGIKLLKQNLPHVLKCGADEIIIVDDCSPENDQAYIKQHFPEITTFKNETNIGFGSTVNKGVQEANNDIIILLNQDTKPDKHLLKPLTKLFKDEQVFGVSFAEEMYGPTKVTFEQGYISHQPVTPIPKQTTTTGWISGGSGAFRKSHWNELGGFDPLFDPYYWEDFDLSYRALKQGWTLLWEPRCKVKHQHESTIGSQHINQTYKQRIQERNHLLLNWKNLQDPALKRQHYRAVLKRTVQHPGYLRILAMAIKQYPQLKQSQQEQLMPVVSDREILEIAE